MSREGNRIRVRRARHEDALAVEMILRHAFAQYEPLYTKEGYEATTPSSDAILFRMQQGPIWIAAHEMNPVGTVSALQKGPALYLRGMAVIPEARGLGIGRLLLQEVAQLAQDNNAEKLYLSTTPFLHSAISLYRRFGFVETADGPHDLFGTPLFTMEKKIV